MKFNLQWHYAPLANRVCCSSPEAPSAFRVIFAEKYLCMTPLNFVIFIQNFIATIKQKIIRCASTPASRKGCEDREQTRFVLFLSHDRHAWQFPRQRSRLWEDETEMKQLTEAENAQDEHHRFQSVHRPVASFHCQLEKRPLLISQAKPAHSHLQEKYR